MKKTVRKLLKWILRIFLLFLIFVAFYILILAYPKPLFANKLTHNNYTVYSDEEIPTTFTEILKDVENRLKVLEIYDSTLTPNIFICNSKNLYGFFVTLVGLTKNSQGFNISLFGNAFIQIPRVEYINRYHDKRLKYTHLTGNIEHVISHELVHILDTKYYGFWNSKYRPVWKAEGYCEYGSTIALIRKDSTNNLYKRASHYFEHDLYGASNHSKIYYRAQLMVEYLFEKKNYTIDMLADTNTKGDNVFKELKQWYFSNNHEY